MQRVPDKIEDGNFVSEKLDAEKRDADADNPPALEQVQRRRKIDYLRVREQSKSREGRIKIQSGGEAGSGDQPEQISRRKVRRERHQLMVLATLPASQLSDKPVSERRDRV